MSQKTEQLLSWYSEMLSIRKLDENVNTLLKQGLMFGFSHQYIGQEAISVGVCANLQPDDYITSNHRGHGHCLSKSGNLKFILAELLGKETGYCRGNGGSAHIADQESCNLGANGIVGAGAPIAAGAALASVLRGEKRISVCFFGDGAANQGATMEAMNFAAVKNLPMIFLCENNNYAVSASFANSTKVESIAKRAEGFGIPAETIDGNDVELVYETAKRAADRVRSGNGPYLIECITYRWKGHSTNDQGSYRTAEELEAWKEKCPIKALKDKLLKSGVTEAELEAREAQVDAEFEEALQFAIDSPFPKPEDSLSYVYAPSGGNMEWR